MTVLYAVTVHPAPEISQGERLSSLQMSTSSLGSAGSSVLAWNACFPSSLSALVIHQDGPDLFSNCVWSLRQVLQR